MSSDNPVFQPPTGADLQRDPLVQEALNQAWNDSCSGESAQRHEEGGWIYMDKTSGNLSIRRAPSGAGTSIDLSDPPVLAGSVVVGKFHTHPHPSSEGWSPGPSRTDEVIDARHGVPDLIKADDGIYLSGPVSRRGGLGGHGGYPE